MPFTGSCLCGQVRYSVSSDLGQRIICHCKNCRKATGTSFNTSTACDNKHFTLISGASVVRTYLDKATDSGASIERSFCSNCGSCVYSRNLSRLPDGVVIHVGTIDTLEDGADWTPQLEVYCKNKPEWLKIEGTITSEVQEGLFSGEA